MLIKDCPGLPLTNLVTLPNLENLLFVHFLGQIIYGISGECLQDHWSSGSHYFTFS